MTTPPQIVAAAHDGAPAALGAFIAQELENWGFIVEADGNTAKLYIGAEPLLEVSIRQVADAEVFARASHEGGESS